MSTPQVQDWQQVIAERGGVPVTAVSLTGASGQLVTGIGLITSVTVANNSATTPAVLQLRDGSAASSPMLAAFSVPAGGGVPLGAGNGGIYFGTGLYISNTSGAATVTVTYIPLYYPLK